jgi:transcriptional regulator GlxA family with amidase domain
MTVEPKRGKTIAFAVYPGLRLLDLVSTYSTLVGLTLDRGLGYRLVTVGDRREPTATDTPLAIVPQATYADLPTPHALVVPGAGQRVERVLSNDGLLAYVRSAGEDAAWVVGSDTGALALAAVGALQGRQATTHWSQYGALERMGVHYVRRPWVEDGKYITAAGVSGGGDMALHLLARYRNEAAARLVQLMAEYDPEPPFGGIDWTRLNGAGAAAAPEASATSGERTIAFVIYPGLTPLDLVGPLQVLTELSKYSPRFRTLVVAEERGPLVADNGLTLVPDKTFDEVPHPSILVVPGGGEPTLAAMSNPAIRQYVASAAKTAETVASVCTGALILAAVGLLEGKPATTHWAYASVLEALGSPYRRARWVEDGRFILSAGVSAGVDMALYLAARLTDEATARRVQLALHYDPHPPFGGIAWGRMPWLARILRASLSLRAPFIAARPKRLRAAGG